MRNFRKMLGAVSVAIVAVGIVPMASTSQAEAMPDAPRGVFRVRCLFSHSLADDPIVKFKQPGASHLHDFFGNTSTNAFSTPAKLKLGGTTCQNTLDKSGYWVPNLTVDGASVTPFKATAYYDNANKALSTIMAPPSNLRIVAGNAHATAPQGNVTEWDCGNNDSTPATAEPPVSCPTGTNLVLHVRFPDCWDGTNRDSPDHQSHMAYNVNDVCPPTHPVPVARLRFNVHYPTQSGENVALSSGGAYSGHADFFNGWNMTELKRLVKTCIRGGLNTQDARCDQDMSNG